jgi:alkylated DNA repair dioxygenase AlkB
MNNIDINNERIAITCGDAGENHAGMEMLGELGEEGSGFTIKDLKNIKKYVEKNGKKCDYYDLSNDEAVIIKRNGTKLERINKKKKAGVLILRNFLNEEQVQSVYEELDSVEWDSKYYDTRRGKVLNKNARENLVFLKGKSQEPDYKNKKGRIVDWTKLKNFNLILENLFNIINTETKNKAKNLIAEGNRYRKYKVVNNKMKKVHNGIGWHGDAERRKVVCICIGGVEYCMKWQWFYKNKPINSDPFEVSLNSGDVYIMSEEAVGQKWKSSSIYTLRHCAGADSNSRFVKYKKEWMC